MAKQEDCLYTSEVWGALTRMLYILRGVNPLERRSVMDCIGHMLAADENIPGVFKATAAKFGWPNTLIDSTKAYRTWTDVQFLRLDNAFKRMKNSSAVWSIEDMQAHVQNALRGDFDDDLIAEGKLNGQQ